MTYPPNPNSQPLDPTTAGRARLGRRDLLRVTGLFGAAGALGIPGALLDAAPRPARAAAGGDVTKTASTYYTAEKVVAARRNVARYDWARTLRDEAVAAADQMIAKGDEWLWNLVTTQGLPRSYAVNQALGSPITGKGIYQYGNYPWLADPLGRPWKLVDPSVPEGDSRPRVYPTNDFPAFYRSGLDEHGNFDRSRADRSLLVNELYPEKGPTWGVDDGYGWVDGNGDKWTFVAYYNHWWNWYGNDALLYANLAALRDAFIYTADLRYARAGLILVDRIADVYPSMDTAPYRREDGYLHSDGLSRKGRVVGCIWETGLARNIAAAYDAFFPAIADGDAASVVPFLSEKSRQYGLNRKDTVADIKRNVHDGLLREIHEAVLDAKIYGNFGMHQSTLAMAAVVHDHPTESKQWIDFTFATGGRVRDPDYRVTGGNIYTTLAGTVDRDGQGNEASPAYNRLWVRQIGNVADILAGYHGYPSADLYAHPKFRKMFTALVPLTMLNRYIPQIGDTGSTGNPGLLIEAQNFVLAFEKYGLPEFAQLAYLANGDTVTGLYSDVFAGDIEGTQRRIQDVIATRGTLALPSDNLTGYGFAALRAGVRDAARSAWIYYGRNTGHGHRDALNLGMYGFGVDLLPELGYPEFADDNARRIEWNANTIAHNTVVVDAGPQQNQWVGTPYGFAATDRVQLADIAAPKAYPQTSRYRRTTALVAADETNSYAVDVFRVVGGADHHLSFHAAEGPVTTEGLSLVAQPKGTYAGPDVEPPPDDAPPRPGVNGFDWLSNVERDNDPTGPFSVDWSVQDTWDVHETDPDLHLRLTVLSDVDDVALCDGIPPRNKPGNPARLRYLIAHRGDDSTGNHVAQIAFPRRTGSTAGDYGALSQRISVHQADSHHLSVWVRDSYTGATAGYHFAQVLIDGVVVAEQDVAGGGGGWRELTADVTEALAGKTATTLTLRLFEKRGVGNFAVVVLFDDVSISGTSIENGDFEDTASTAWQPESTSSDFTIDAAATGYSSPQATDELASQFVSLIEPYVGQRFVRSARTVPVRAMGAPVAAHEAVAVRVELTNGRVDYVISSARPDVVLRVDDRIMFRGGFGVYSLRDGEAEYGFSHQATLLGPLPEMEAPRREVTGRLADFTRDLSVQNRLVVTLDDELAVGERPGRLVGGYAYVDNDGVRNAVYRIVSAKLETPTRLVLDIGDATPIREYVDPADFSKGYRYDVATGAAVRIPLTREWSRS